LSSKYITDRQFPDKAIDVLDELGSDKKINSKIPEVIENEEDSGSKKSTI
jgi:ATP-dependent Clp protease ATP-binding subunit ClpA